MLFQYQIRPLLKSRGMTQRELARQVGMHSPTISDMARKPQSQLRAGATEKLIRFFDVPFSELVHFVEVDQE